MVINAYNYVRMMKNRGVNIRVTNNSYGGCPKHAASDIAVKNAIDALGDAGVLNVFAAGNSGTNNDISPSIRRATSRQAFCRSAALTQNDNRIFNYGPTIRGLRRTRLYHNEHDANDQQPALSQSERHIDVGSARDRRRRSVIDVQPGTFGRVVKSNPDQLSVTFFRSLPDLTVQGAG